MPKVQKLDNEVLHSIWTQQTLLIDGSVWTHGLSTLNWCFYDSGAVYKCDHLVSNVALLDIRSCLLVLLFSAAS